MLKRTHLTGMNRRLALAVLLIMAHGCSTDDTDSNGDSGSVQDTVAVDDTSASREAQTQIDTTSPDVVASDVLVDDASNDCDRTGYTPVAQDAGHFLGAFNYVAQDTLAAPVSVLSFELVDPNGATSAGDYTITNADYSTCANCIKILLDCDENLANCAKTFLAQEGTMKISSFGTTGGQFAGTLTDVVLREVTINSNSVSTLVPNGETWCLPAYSFSASVQ